MTQLLYHGHGSLALSTNKQWVVEIDPYAGNDYLWEANLILVSHHHHDHDRVDLIKHQKDCSVIDPAILHPDGKYLSMDFGEVTVQAVPAYNAHHPRDFGMGFVLMMDGLKIYLSGDTSYVEEMARLKELQLDYAFLCCDGIYNMDLSEAAKCRQIIGAKHTFVYHTSPEKLFASEKIPEFTASGFEYVLPGEVITLK